LGKIYFDFFGLGGSGTLPDADTPFCFMNRPQAELRPGTDLLGPLLAGDDFGIMFI